MKAFSLTFFTIFILSISPFGVQSQTLINQEWSQHYGLPDTIAWSASVADLSGNLYTVGNTLQNGQYADVLFTKYDTDGNTIWQQTYDYQGNNDYGVAITLHADGDITLAVAGYSNTTDFNFGLLHYHDDGTLEWDSFFDYEGLYDVPVAISTDISDNIYCAGVSSGSITNLDYYTIKCSGSGSLLWSNSYDFVQGRDVPVSIAAEPEEIVITGASEDSTGNWDFYTIAYDSAGSFLYENRLNKPGLSFDEPAAIARDNSGNFYLTGRASDDGVTYYIQTVKLDAQLDQVWTTNYNHGTSEGATSLGLDSQGNIYVADFSIG